VLRTATGPFLSNVGFLEPHRDERGLVGGRRLDAMVRHVDLVPTILQGSGLAVPDGLHGRSFWPVLTNEAARHQSLVFVEKAFHTAYEPQCAVRTERYRLIANLEVEVMNMPGDVLRSLITPQVSDEIVCARPWFELYDLHDDPNERLNRIGDPTLASVASKLKRELLA